MRWVRTPGGSYPSLGSDSPDKVREGPTILDRWDFTADELTELVDKNPSLRGILLGYLAELKLTHLLHSIEGVSTSRKDDDHNRRRKGDRVISFHGREIVIEAKSLQTNLVKQEGNRWTGHAQVDASDRREVALRDGSKLNTTCLLVGEFDILAVNIFAFRGEWDFVFARNEDLPRSTFRKYSAEQQSQLLATLVPVAWPPERPFVEDPLPLFEDLARGR